MDPKKLKIAVTPTSFGKDDPRMRTYLESQVGEVVYNTTGKPMDAATLAEFIRDADGFIAGLDEINADVINGAQKLKVIARYGVGYSNVDLDAARKMGIIVTITPGANAASVADLAVAFILLLCRPVCRADALTKQGEWPRFSGLSLENKTVGLYGFGAIGRQVARKLAGFECRLIAYDLYPPPETTDLLRPVEMVSREEIIAVSDFLSLHIPASGENHDLVNREFISRMKDGAFLINTARGELIDEQALAEAIISKKLAGAALDAFKQEPPKADNPLIKLPQVILTPHMGAHAESATNRMGWMALEDCLAVLRGENPKYPLAVTH